MEYYSQFKRKRFNEIVVAGSHDAGITGGPENAQTQTLNLGDQAAAGVRVFDLRIAGSLSITGSEVKLKAFHADPKVKFDNPKFLRQRVSELPGKHAGVVVSSLAGGTFGEKLGDMLDQAREFVTNIEPTEFLILKFDKGTNWKHVADLITQKLNTGPNPCLYTAGGDIGTKTLKQLKGKVVVLFPRADLAALGAGYGYQQGFLGFKPLNKPGNAYSQGYHGLQFVGKGGTAAMNGASTRSKTAEQETKQWRLLGRDANKYPAEAVGMMYWTTTGVMKNIEERNQKMWIERTGKAPKMQALFASCLRDSILPRVPHGQDMNNYGGAQTLKILMPNIVMIDFVDEKKCQTIYDLNAVAATQLTEWARYLAGA